MKLLIILSLAVILKSVNSFATDASTCKDTVEKRANIQLQVLFSAQERSCFLTVTPLDSYKTLTYRDYLMSDEGILLVFNSLNSSENNDSTAAREFYFFPRLRPNPTYLWNDQERRLEVTHTNGDTFYFDYDTAQIKAMGRGQVVVAAEIKKENRGGVEILNYKGLVLDVGFAIGHSPSEVGSGAAQFTDYFGKNCHTLNREVFVTTPSQDVRFKFSDTELVPFIKKSCPQLKYP